MLLYFLLENRYSKVFDSIKFEYDILIIKKIDKIYIYKKKF